MEPLREVPLARVERASRAALQPRQSSCSAGMDARRAHGYHGSREHGNERNAGGLAAGSSGLARAQAMLTGETYSCSQRNDGKASVARRRCARSASFVKDRKELITDHFCQEKIKRRARCTVGLRRKHQLRNLPGLQAHTGVQCAVCTVQVQARGPKPRPDVQQTPRGAANTERNACARRGQTVAARCRPVGRCPAARRRAGIVWHGCVRARSTCTRPMGAA